MNKFVIKLINFYQSLHATTQNSHCRYYPTCSNYGIQAYKKHNFFYATLLTTWRVLRCNPLSKGGYDPVPPTKIEKLFKDDYKSF